MATHGASYTSGLHILLSKSVPHILENIFFSLDYKSFDACREVCGAWKDLLATDKYQKRYAEMLVEKIYWQKKLLDASSEGKVDIVTQLLSQGVDPNTYCQWSIGDKIAWKSTPLHMAIDKGHIDVVKVLLYGGADPNKKDLREFPDGSTPLMLATMRDNSEVIKLLLQAGAEPNEANNAAWNTPLHMAAIYCSRDAVEVLLAGGADPQRVNKVGHSPLNEILWNAYHMNYIPICAGEDKRGLAEVVKLLLDAGAVPHEDFRDNINYVKLFAHM